MFKILIISLAIIPFVAAKATNYSVLIQNDPGFSQNIVKAAFALRNEIADAKKANNQKLLGNLENLKKYIPNYVQNLTCSKVKFYNTHTKGYLYADLKILQDPKRRYVFADGKFNDYTTTWRFRYINDYVYIDNDFLSECLYPFSDARTVLTWIPAGTCGDNAWFVIEPVPARQNFRVRNTKYNEYLEVTNNLVQGKRTLITGSGSNTSYFEIHCAD